MKNKWRNKQLWLSIASLILLVLNSVGLNIIPEQFNEITNATLSVLVGIGVISQYD